VRISGRAAIGIADEMFRCPAPRPSDGPDRSLMLGHIVDARGERIDQALLLVMRAPRSYTGEDIVELQFHGGAVLARMVLRRAIECGCRPAEPGEFTRRAFLSGKIDLAQAEAVMDLVRSTSERAVLAAVEQLDGSVSRAVGALYDEALSVVADIEALLDFPEEDLPADSIELNQKRIRSIAVRCDRLVSQWRDSGAIRDGAVVPIVGKTNSGKSSIFNALVGRDRSIVSQYHGTTRDTIEDMIQMDGLYVRLIDTAGLRDSDCEIEAEGVRRSMKAMETATLVLHVVDASRPMDESDLRIFARSAGKSWIVVLNKRDLPHVTDSSSFPGVECVSTAAICDGGVDDLRTAISTRLTKMVAGDHVAVASERHRLAMETSLAYLRKAADLLDVSREHGLDTASSCLRFALHSMGIITGRSFDTELLDSIFSRFCIGK